MKEELGKQIEALRKECGVSTYRLDLHLVVHRNKADILHLMQRI